jgi:hypothetical protein
MSDNAIDHGGATLLAAQPLTIDRDRKPGADWLTIFTHLEARLGMLRLWRWSWWVHWAALARFLLPYRYHWVITANTTNRGNPVNESIVDSTATLAMRVCASGMLAGLMSPSRPWFKLGVALPNFDLDADGQAWLDDTAERIYAILGGSNFYTEAGQLFQDVATFGTSPLIIYEDHEDVIRCYVPCAGEYFLATGGRLSVDSLYREFTYTVAQVVDWFGLEACPAEIRANWEEGGALLEREVIVAHAIEPNFLISARNGKKTVRVVPGSFPYREVYWLRGRKTEAELSRKGFHERPFMAVRWSKTSNDAYGRGPGMDALPDTQQLQQEQRRKGEFIDKMVRPPMGASLEMEHRPSSILPGEVTYTIGGQGRKEGFWPLFEINGQGMAPLTADIESVQKRIDRCFFTDVFLMISQMEGVQPRNELEIAERKGEKIQMLGPVIELFETEVASPALQRVISIAYRRGLLKPPPKSLHGVPISIEYISMMKMAQRAAEIGGMQQTVGTAAKLSEAAMATHVPGGAQLPDPMRIINLDETLRFIGDRYGFPARLLYTDEQVQAADKIRDQHAQQQQAMQAIPAAVQAAEGASKIDIGGGQNPVAAMLGGQAGAQTGAGA